jgi:hypothetical protein
MKIPVLVSLTLLTLTASAQSATRNVILVTIDGLRWQEVFRGADEAFINTEFGGVSKNAIEATRETALAPTAEERRKKIMPFLWGEIATRGQIFGNRDRGSPMRVANAEWFSYPGYNELLCGFPDALVTSNLPIPNKNISVLEWLNGRERFSGRVAACTTWQIFPAILNVGRSRLPMWVSGQQYAALTPKTPQFAEIARWMEDIPTKSRDEHYDGFGFRAALEMIDIVRPRVLYVALGEPDTNAHRRRYDAYLESILLCDRFVRQIWEKLQSMDEFRGTTTLIVTTDHGRGRTPQDWMNHDKKTPGSDETWLAVLGPDTPARGERVDAAPVVSAQIAATLAALLGEDFTASDARVTSPISEVIAK